MHDVATFYHVVRIIRIIICLGAILTVAIRVFRLRRHEKARDRRLKEAAAESASGSGSSASEAQQRLAAVPEDSRSASGGAHSAHDETLGRARTIMIGDEEHTLKHKARIKPFWWRVVEAAPLLAFIVFLYSLDDGGVFIVYTSRGNSAVMKLMCRAAMVVVGALLFMRFLFYFWANALPHKFESVAARRRSIAQFKLSTFLVVITLVLWCSAPSFRVRFLLSGIAVMAALALSVWVYVVTREHGRIHMELTHNEAYKGIVDQSGRAVESTSATQRRSHVSVVWKAVSIGSSILSVVAIAVWCSTAVGRAESWDEEFDVHKEELVRDPGLWPAESLSDFSFEFWCGAIAAGALAVFIWRTRPEQYEEPIFMITSVVTYDDTTPTSSRKLTRRITRRLTRRLTTRRDGDAAGGLNGDHDGDSDGGDSDSLVLVKKCDRCVLLDEQKANGMDPSADVELDVLNNGNANTNAPTFAVTGREDVRSLLAMGIRLQDIPCTCQHKTRAPMRLSPGELMMTGGARHI